MQVGSYAFRPGWVPTLATLVVLTILVSLGVWQLDRAQQKRLVETEYQTRQARSPMPLKEALAQKRGYPYLPVTASGRYDPAHQLLLDNQIREGRVGYRVLTPFQMAGMDRILLVDRGWVPMGLDRSILPPIPVDGGVRKIKGVLSPPPSPGLILGPAINGPGRWPQVIERVQPDTIGARLGATPLPDLLLLDPREADGYLREWRPPGLGVERHIGYAVQWFAMAAVLLFIYLKRTVSISA
jgi:surfeit locus 1 family protein